MKTGIDWCELDVTTELTDLAAEARANELRVCGLMEGGGEEALSRSIIADGVDAAEALARNARLGADEFLDGCLALTGEPWGQARARRDVRERVRLCRRLRRCGHEVPTAPEELIALWSEANDGEAPLYEGAEIARFRTSGVPFAHGATPFDPAPVPAGFETLAAERIPGAVEALLAFARRGDVPLEVRAAAVHFLHGHIHPFRDGNGHAGRMLACAMLAERYSTPTLLALLRRLQGDRDTIAHEMAATVRERAGLDRFCAFFLRMLHAAQRDVEPERPGHARLPLRRVDAAGLELVSAHRKDRSVYRVGDERMLKTVAGAGQLTRACAVFDAQCAAHGAGTPIVRPYELVRTQDGYAVLLERADGPTLSELVAARALTPRQAGEALAGAIGELHAACPADARLSDARKLLARMVDACARSLPELVRQGCESLIEGLPEPVGLVHGDCNPGNLVVRADGSSVFVDAGTVCLGDPIVDLAFARSSLVCEGEVDRERQERCLGISCGQALELWEALFDECCAGKDEANRAEAERFTQVFGWLAVLNRLETGADPSATLGERALCALQAIARIAQALRIRQGACHLVLVAPSLLACLPCACCADCCDTCSCCCSTCCVCVPFCSPSMSLFLSSGGHE